MARGRLRATAPRHLVQATVLLGTVVGVFVVRGHAERWCPFGGVETLWSRLREGNVLCSLAVTNLVVLGALLLGVLLVRRAFCSHACPVGALSEGLGRLGARLGLKPWRVPLRVDRVLSALPYLVLGLVLAVTWHAGELLFRGACPAYALLGRHGEDATTWTYGVAGAVVVGSLLVSLPFCRWLCPLAAVMNPLSRRGLARVRREGVGCTSCGRCARVCPMGIPVHAVDEVTDGRCTACLACVAACPRRGRRVLALRLPGRSGRTLGPWTLAVLVGVLLAGGVVAAVVAPGPSFAWSRGALPAVTAQVDWSVDGLTCRGRANLLVWFLDRGDDLAVEGPLRVEAWPAPGSGRLRLRYDPAATDEEALRLALTEAVHEPHTRTWRLSPFLPGGVAPP